MPLTPSRGDESTERTSGSVGSSLQCVSDSLAKGGERWLGTASPLGILTVTQKVACHKIQVCYIRIKGDPHVQSDLSVEDLTTLFRQTIRELQQEPEFQSGGDRISYATDAEGEPSVKVALGNVGLDYDLWPVSVMLPFSRDTTRGYAQTLLDQGTASLHRVSRMLHDINLLIDKATSRVGMDLVDQDTVVVAMDTPTVRRVSTEAVPATQQGTSHGPSKGGNYPQKSIAALTGLGQFGIARFIFRDEVVDGSVQRFIGPLRSLVLFDKKNLVTDGSGGVLALSERWREFLFRLYDFTAADKSTATASAPTPLLMAAAAGNASRSAARGPWPTRCPPQAGAMHRRSSNSPTGSGRGNSSLTLRGTKRSWRGCERCFPSGNVSAAWQYANTRAREEKRPWTVSANRCWA